MTPVELEAFTGAFCAGLKSIINRLAISGLYDDRHAAFGGGAMQSDVSDSYAPKCVTRPQIENLNE